MAYSCPYCRQQFKQPNQPQNVVCPKCSLLFHMPAAPQRPGAMDATGASGWMLALVAFLFLQWHIIQL